ncbi:MAG: TolC family protein [Opitutaceae bacterium]|nr:TolC family protein [Cytophagales bacterium]
MGLKKTLVLTLLCFTLNSCKLFKPITVNAGHSIPESFTNNTDSLSIGFIPRNQFFTDSNLIRLIDTAIVYNLDLQRALQRIQHARAGMLYARGRYLPTVNAGVGVGIDKFGKYTMNGVGNFDSNLSSNLTNDQQIPDPYLDLFVGARSSWEVSLWGNNKNLNKAAKARFLSTEMGKNLIITSLVADIATLYYELLALDNELLTIRKNLELQQKAMNTIHDLKIGGKANELAVKQFEAQYLDTKSLEVLIQQDIIKSENILNVLLGSFPKRIVRGLPIREQSLPDQASAGVPSFMLVRRPDIRQAELELVASKSDVKLARAAFLPSLTIGAYGGFNAFKAPLLFSNPASLVYGTLSGLTMPLLNRSVIKSNYRKSVAYQLDSYYAYQKTILTGFQEVVTSLNGIKNYELIYQIKEEEVDALLKAVIASKDLFEAGYATYLEVITAQKLVLKAELELSEAKKNQFHNVIELYRSLGGGWN